MIRPFEAAVTQPGASTSSILSAAQPKPKHPVDLVDEQALWLWGRLRAERKWRQLYDDGGKARAGRPPGNQSSDTTDFRGAKTLADHGVSRDEAARGARLAAIPDDEFELRLAERPRRLPQVSG